MDVSIAIESLMPAAKYSGSLTENTKESYEALVWLDARQKPSWVDLQSHFTDVYEPAQIAAKQAKKNRKEAVLAKLGLQKSDLPALLELIDERNAE